MPFYKYEAIKRDGTKVNATLFGTSLIDLEENLKGRELILVEAEEVKQKPANKQLIGDFITEFSPLIESGISIDKALSIIAEDVQDKKLGSLAMDLYATIKQGGSLSQAMQETGLFESYATALVQAGEASGQLPKVLDSLEEHYAVRAKLKSEIVSALAYPAILFVVSMLSLIAISYKVIPRFEELFADKMEVLPTSTLIIFAASDFLKNYSLPLLTIMLVIAILLMVLYRKSEGAKYSMDTIFLKLPGIGKHLQLSQGTNFSNMLGVLLESGVPLLQAMELAKNVLTLGPLLSGAEEAINEVRRGEPLHRAAEFIPYFPKLTTRFIKVGEEAGNLGTMVAKAGNILSLQLQHKLKRFAAVLGPVVILIMGGLIGMIVISMLSAVYSFSDVL